MAFYELGIDPESITQRCDNNGGPMFFTRTAVLAIAALTLLSGGQPPVARIAPFRSVFRREAPIPTTVTVASQPRRASSTTAA